MDLQTVQAFSQDPLPSVKGERDPKKIAAQFEAIFYKMILKQMRESETKDDLFSSSEMEMVQGLNDEAVAEEIGKRGDLGIGQIVLNYIAKHESEDTVSPDQFETMFNKPSGLLKG